MSVTEPAFCADCGSARAPGAAFCTECGNRFATVEAQSTAPAAPAETSPDVAAEIDDTSGEDDATVVQPYPHDLPTTEQLQQPEPMEPAAAVTPWAGQQTPSTMSLGEVGGVGAQQPSAAPPQQPEQFHQGDVVPQAAAAQPWLAHQTPPTMNQDALNVQAAQLPTAPARRSNALASVAVVLSGILVLVLGLTIGVFFLARSEFDKAYSKVFGSQTDRSTQTQAASSGKAAPGNGFTVTPTSSYTPSNPKAGTGSTPSGSTSTPTLTYGSPSTAPGGVPGLGSSGVEAPIVLCSAAAPTITVAPYANQADRFRVSIPSQWMSSVQSTGVVRDGTCQFSVKKQTQTNIAIAQNYYKDQAKTEAATITYDRESATVGSLSGYVGTDIFYIRTVSDGTRAVTMKWRYPASLKSHFDAAVTRSLDTLELQ